MNSNVLKEALYQGITEWLHENSSMLMGQTPPSMDTKASTPVGNVTPPASTETSPEAEKSSTTATKNASSSETGKPPHRVGYNGNLLRQMSTHYTQNETKSLNKDSWSVHRSPLNRKGF